MKCPASKRLLDDAIQRLAGTKTYDIRYTGLRAIIADVVIGQMLPDCVVKGGSSLKLRYGAEHTRFTMDFDAASQLDVESFIKATRENLARGWNDFTGTMDIERPASPKGIPAEYIMQPFLVRLNYRGKSWCSVRLELSHNEIGDADEGEAAPIASDILRLFEELGFPQPQNIPLMPLRFQIAQKLHGLSAPGSTRVRDIIDLQLIMRNSNVALPQIKPICERLFAYRKCHTWPPTITKGDGWEEQYAAQKFALPVLPSIDEAIAWANSLVRQIVTAE